MWGSEDERRQPGGGDCRLGRIKGAALRGRNVVDVDNLQDAAAAAAAAAATAATAAPSVGKRHRSQSAAAMHSSSVNTRTV